MTTETAGALGIKRCPQCYQVPKITVQDNALGFKLILECEFHGHMAMGETLEEAAGNWNVYIDFMIEQYAKKSMDVLPGREVVR
jgi:hypothetical protein